MLDGLGQSYGRTSGNEAEPPMMWNANYGGPQFYGFTTYSKTPLMLSMLGGIVGDSAVQRAHREWGNGVDVQASVAVGLHVLHEQRAQAATWAGSGTTGCSRPRASMARSRSVTSSGDRTTRHRAGRTAQMPSPVVLEVKFAASGSGASVPCANARDEGRTTAIVTYPVDVWFAGSRTFDAELDFGGRTIERITLDPGCRFPDRDPDRQRLGARLWRSRHGGGGMRAMIKALSVPERLFKFAMWVVSFVFAGFLIGLGGKIVGDLPGVDQRITLEQFIDADAMAALNAQEDSLRRAERVESGARERAQLSLTAAENAYTSAREASPTGLPRARPPPIPRRIRRSSRARASWMRSVRGCAAPSRSWRTSTCSC